MDEAEGEDDSSENMELGDGQPAAAPPSAAVDAVEQKGREFLQALREAGTSSCNMMFTMVEAGLADIRRLQMEAAEADEQDEAAAGTSEAQFRSLSADDDEEGESPASNPAPAFRALSVDDDAEDMAAVGPLARSLGAEGEEETVELGRAGYPPTKPEPTEPKPSAAAKAKAAPALPKLDDAPRPPHADIFRQLCALHKHQARLQHPSGLAPTSPSPLPPLPAD